MPTYNVIRKSDGVVVHNYSSTNVVEWDGMGFSEYDHIEMIQNDELPTKNVESSVKITKLAFRNRFKPSEKIALELASKDNLAETLIKRQQAAMIKVYLDDVNSASFIDLLRNDTRQGVLLLESFGLINPGRAIEILDKQPTEEELFNG